MAYNEILKGILAKRGIVTDEELNAYLNPTLGDLAKPEELPGIEGAAKALLSAVKRGREIVVFGDYDCDGVCATAILVKALNALNAKVSPFIPERLTEGYGMGDKAVKRMIAEHPKAGLVVTVDNGINSVDRVNELKRHDIEVIVTDHHLPGDELPNCPIVDPKVSAPKKLDSLCGASVSFMLANALIELAHKEGIYNGGKIAGELLIMAGLATVTDIMPLLGQNRIIVAESLKRFRILAPMGLMELYLLAARTPMEILSVRDFSFLLGPRINASGRIASCMDSLELMFVRDRERAHELALKVNGFNQERKEVEQYMVEAAFDQVVPNAPAQIIEISDGHQGVAGIVASRLIDRMEGGPKPVCVIMNRRGSARAPDGYNVRDLFTACSEVLEDYGGHAAAGGFTVKEGRMDDFRVLFFTACLAQRDKLAKEGATPVANRVDAVVRMSDLTMSFAEDVRRMEPFGEGNSEPIFRLENVRITDVRPVGQEGKHLCLAVKADCHRLRGVWWGAGDQVEDLRMGSGVPFNIDFHIGVSDYQERHVELNIINISSV